MGSNHVFGSGVPTGAARVPMATFRPWAQVCPVIAVPTSNPEQGIALPIATFDRDLVAAGGVKRPVFYPPGSTRTDHDG